MSDLWAQRIYVWLAILNANMGLGTNTKKDVRFVLVAYLTFRAFELAYSVKISNVRNPRRYVCIVLLVNNRVYACMCVHDGVNHAYGYD